MSQGCGLCHRQMQVMPSGLPKFGIFSAYPATEAGWQ